MLPEEFVKLIAQHGINVAGMSAQAVQMLVRLWSSFRDWYDDDLVIARSARSAFTVQSAQHAMRRRQRSYLRFVYNEMGIPIPAREEIDAFVNGLSGEIPGSVEVYPREASALDVYQRPAEQFRYARSIGETEMEALQKALERVKHTTHTDLQLAKRAESRAVFSATPQVTAYRRIIHPELSESGMSCGLCVVASQRLYFKEELMPLHDECNCEVLPVTTAQDPGKILNDEDLQAVYDAAGSNNAGDLLKTRVAFTEHGELGPIIANERPKGYTPRKIEKDTRTARERLEYEKSILQQSTANLQERARRGEDVRLAIQWQHDRMVQINRDLATLRRVS